ncbi:MAG: RNA 2',3'-cyclic phosphodiesterase [Chloroflexi bacterium]|nr:RNA 2',3'-cyclic phosphodiesterase [Chloroflexota bacterium]
MKYRLFISVNLSPELLVAMRALQNELKRRLADAPLRWVRPEGIHISLKFLGETEPARVQKIVRALEKTVGTHDPFEVGIGGLGCFPNNRRPNVLWVGVTDPERALERLAADVDRSMVALGWKPERRAFTGHLTLARVKKYARPAERRELGRIFVESGLGQDMGRLRVNAIHLMRSELRRDGAVYTELAEISLRRQ